MKYFQKILVGFFFLTGLFFSGCKSKIDLVPYDSFDANTAFTTPERCLLALNGVYDAAQSAWAQNVILLGAHQYLGGFWAALRNSHHRLGRGDNTL